jgi:serine/threonine-protein kinase
MTLWLATDRVRHGAAFSIVALLMLGTLVLPGRALAQNYGAVATSDSGNSYGFSHDYSSQSEAEDAAVDNCPGDCVSRVWFSDGCGAVAQSSEYVAWGIGDSRSEAEENALSACDECELVAWACTTR